jgi:hypothetical protein
MNEQSKKDVSKTEGVAMSRREKVEGEIRAAIAQRPVGLRLPHKGFQFRALRDVTVDAVASLRILDSEGPFDVKPGVVSKGEVLRLDYEPPHATSTVCSLVPKRYDELEMSFVDSRTREMKGYSGFSFYVSYIQLDKDFEWFETEG